MIGRSFILLTMLSGALVMVGCATVPNDAGFDDVKSRVAERTGVRVDWAKEHEAERRMSDAVASALRRDLTADAAVEIALLNNRDLQATYEELGIAQAELVEAGLPRNPTLTAEIRFPKSPAYPFDIDVTQQFLDLLFIPLRKQIAGAQFEAAKWRVTSAVANAAAETTAAFYRAQGAEQLIDLRRKIVQAAEASIDAAKRLHDAGNITDRAFASEKAMYEQAKLVLGVAEADVLDAREELSAAMGVWGRDTEWKIAPRLPDLPATEIEPKGLESLAVQQRADLQAARAHVEALAQSLGLTKSSSLFPDASATVHWSGEPDGTKSLGPGIEVPLPLFNQGQPAIAAAQARLRQSEQQFAAMAVRIRSDVRRARSRLFAARARAEYQRNVIVPLRHEIVQQSQLEYNAMQLGVFELLQARQAEIDAGRDYVESLRDYWVARTELEKALGGRSKAILPATAPSTRPTAPTQEPPQPQGHQHHGA